MKLALLIGINYNGSRSQLNGCINDVTNVKKLLIEEYGYINDNINMMTDNTNVKPTRDNIIMALLDICLAINEKDVDEIWIHYSGHGSHVKDYDGDELDRRDEVLVPLDYEENGFVTDDLIKYILTKIKKECKCVIVFDCCHSGTMADLPYNYYDGKESLNTKNSGLIPKVIMLSGCRDKQTSADAKIDGKWAGALTHCLLDTLKKHNYSAKCFDLLNDVRSQLKKEDYDQYPILSCSTNLTPNDMFVIKQN